MACSAVCLLVTLLYEMVAPWPENHPGCQETRLLRTNGGGPFWVTFSLPEPQCTQTEGEGDGFHNHSPRSKLSLVNHSCYHD